jgi:hypothetical protein
MSLFFPFPALIHFCKKTSFHSGSANGLVFLFPFLLLLFLLLFLPVSQKFQSGSILSGSKFVLSLEQFLVLGPFLPFFLFDEL